MLPIEIINKILVYISELNNDIIITQYDYITNKKYYKINFDTDLIWRIKSTLVMKQIYPIYSNVFVRKETIQLYKHGIPHYEKLLKFYKTNNY